MGSPFLPFHLPSIGQAEIDEVVATLRSGWLTTGPRTAAFERDFKDYVNAPYALGVNSCTAALHLALTGLGIGPGDEVITTPLTFCATIHTIVHTGATPVLADIDEDGNICPKSIEDRISPRTRALMPVHLAGLPCQMRAIWEIARRHRLSVIEDAAHAAGSHYEGCPIGAGISAEGLASDAVAFSFYATKNLTTGEGGMVTTHTEALCERMRILCLHGISKDAWNRYSENGSWFYEVVESGFKYNLSDIQSAIGIHQLRRLEQFIESRTRLARLYRELLENVPEIELPNDRPDRRHAWHLYAIRLRTDQLTIDRSRFMQNLKDRGIGASVHFIPIPAHPFSRRFQTLSSDLCPRAMELYPRMMSLPLYPAMSEDDVRRVAGAVKQILSQSRKRAVVATAQLRG